MIISAISDLDILGVDLEPLWDIFKKAQEPDLLLFAGDMYDFRTPETYGLILDFIEMIKWKCPIVAVFGNHEFDDEIKDIKKITKKRIKFLEDDSTVLNIGGKKVGIVGSTGILDSPTWWQFNNSPDMDDEYKSLKENIRKMMLALKGDIRILLTHYAPTYKTLKGENSRYYSVIGSKKMEKVIKETKPTFAVHGHAHYGLPLAFVGSVPVFNVCFEVNKKIIEIDTDKLPRRKKTR
ncbi:MAG: metallophosphoesterase [Candidatus Aenigmatarchaeota archaeon]